MLFHRAQLCLSAALIFSLGFPVIAPANDIEDFLRELNGYREGSREREVQRRTERERRLREARQGDFPQNYDPRSGGYYLRDQDVPPGQYNVELPWGNQNVYVRPEPPPGQSRHHYMPNDVRDQSQIGHIVRQLQNSVHRIKDLSDDFDRDEWEEIADDAEEALEDLEESLRQRNPQRTRQAFEQFEKKWHPLAYLITRASELPEPIRRAYHVVVEQDELLHRNLFVAQGAGYDRVRVAALTNQLATHFDQFANSETWNNRRVPYQLRRKLRTADRAADDLLDAVQSNAPASTVTSDYQRFDEAWHDIRQQASQMDGFDPYRNETIQRIAVLDRQLHQQLEVESNRGDSRSRTQSEIRFALRSADQLAAAISKSPRELRNISQRAQELSLALDELDNAYDNAGFRGESLGRAWGQSQQSWAALQQTVQAVGGPRREGVIGSLYQQLAQDMKALQITFSNDSSHHRHPHHPY